MRTHTDIYISISIYVYLSIYLYLYLSIYLPSTVHGRVQRSGAAPHRLILGKKARG